MKKAGEIVNFGYRNDTNSSAIAEVVLFDANGNARTLMPYERIIVDTLQFNTQASDSTNLAYVIPSLNTPPLTVPSQPVVAAFEAMPIGAQGFVAAGEGYACPTGCNLWLVLVGAAWAGVSVALSGVGRVVMGKSVGPQAAYKALLTPGGNISGQ